MAGFKVFEKKEATTTKIRFEGSMDEHSDYTKIQHKQADTFAIDMGGVTHINSTGIKHWVTWHTAVQFESPNANFIFMNCPKCIIDQINMVQGFLPQRSIIESFRVPYYCETCQKDLSISLIRGKNFKEASGGKILDVPKQNCSREDCAMEPDVVEKKYFAFLDKL